MAELQGWTTYDAAPVGNNDDQGGLRPTFGARKWFGDHYQEVSAASEQILDQLCRDKDAERAALSLVGGEDTETEAPAPTAA